MHAHPQPPLPLPHTPCSYEMPNDPDFRSTRLSLVDRGITFAIAHVRGGGTPARCVRCASTLSAARNLNLVALLLCHPRSACVPSPRWPWMQAPEQCTPPFAGHRRPSLLACALPNLHAPPLAAGEMGRRWYEDGKYLNKKNTFTDFIACAEHLVAHKYTSTDKLCIQGRSAG